MIQTNEIKISKNVKNVDPSIPLVRHFVILYKQELKQVTKITFNWIVPCL